MTLPVAQRLSMLYFANARRIRNTSIAVELLLNAIDYDIVSFVETYLTLSNPHVFHQNLPQEPPFFKDSIFSYPGTLYEEFLITAW